MAVPTVRDLAAEAEGPATGPCGHDHAEVLGEGNDARYLRCGCGTLLIVHRGRTWILRPAPS